jgi:hypothetical protein
VAVRGPEDTQPTEPGWWLASDGKWYPPESQPPVAQPQAPSHAWAPKQQSWSPGATAPSWAPATAKRRRIWPWIVGVIVLFLIGVGSCAALISHAAGRHAITQSQFDSVQLGETRSQVEHDLGSPSSRQNFTNTLGTRSCVYYRQKGHIASTYQFCFQGDQLESKNAF